VRRPAEIVPASSDLGHEEPTLLLTNQLRRSPAKLIGRYAQRMVIENNIAEGINFFHMDALSSAVAMKVSCDLQLPTPRSEQESHQATPRPESATVSPSSQRDQGVL
jgi:hypothetical protein